MRARLDIGRDREEKSSAAFLKERIAAHFYFQEDGRDEAIVVLHNRLLLQRDRRVEARGFRHGILVGLAAGGAVIAASIGAFVLHPATEQVCEVPASLGRSSWVSEEVPILRPAREIGEKCCADAGCPEYQDNVANHD
jgi:hypothetical protein